ncbi:hypothetical protein [Streptomyces sp. NPDC050504]|uniref:hypothetical protein n=1 Tax=Streptomyces sp. NPDC050504 TaxID=3365618 RepID=UPI0037B4C26D
MLRFYLRLLLWAALWCGVGIVLLLALIQSDVVPRDSGYKGAVVFAVMILGTLASAKRMRN